MKITDTKFEYTTIEEYKKIDSDFEINGTEYKNEKSFERVRLVSKPGRDSLIYVEVWLPEKWNSIFIGLGNGGLAGAINHDRLFKYVSEGYAVAHTDMGTSRGREHSIDCADVWQDFGHRATKAMTDIAKKLIFSRYGKAADYSYFLGESTGGQQCFTLAQKYPDSYNGIVAGVPANNRVMLHTYFLWNYVNLKPKGKAGLFTSEEVKLITDSAVEFYQKRNDGQQGDDFVSRPQADCKTISEFILFLKEKNVFSAEQLDALEKVYRGPVNLRTGKRIYNGMPMGSEMFGCGIIDCQGPEPPHFYPFLWAFGKDYDAYSFDFDSDMDKVCQKLSGMLNANSVNLDEFYQNGGKLIAYSGTADPCVPFPDCMNYHKRLCNRYKGKQDEFFKYFIIPGKDHGTSVTETFCENGEEMLCAIRAWCENGKAPKNLLVKWFSENGEESERIIYPENGEGVCPPVCDEYYLNK